MKTLILILFLSAQVFSQSSGLIMLFGDDDIVYIEAANANATTDEQGEVDGRVGWTSPNAPVVTSQDTTVKTGTYAILGYADSPGDRHHVDLDTEYSLQAGTTYNLEVWIRHIGFGGAWRFGFSDDGGSVVDNILLDTDVLDNTYTTYTLITSSFTAGGEYRYLIAIEINGTNNGGVFIDNLRIYK